MARRSGRGAGPGRRKSVRVKTARGRKLSSTRWLQRQLNDPYVQEAKRKGYRSRAAFKLLELDERFGLLRAGARVLDLGAAPGGWSQVAADTVGAEGVVVAVDIQEIEPLAGVTILQGDIYDADLPARVAAALGGRADLVMSDMAAPATGHAQTDHLRTMALLEAAYDIARGLLAPGGAFVGKVLQGGTEQALLTALKRNFAKVAHAKPAASRKESAEMYLVALGFRGEAEN